jgi:hypothetical protein
MQKAIFIHVSLKSLAILLSSLPQYVNVFYSCIFKKPGDSSFFLTTVCKCGPSCFMVLGVSVNILIL